MKKIILTFSIFVLACNTIQAQNRFKEKIETAKIAIISNKLNLSEADAIKFWPVYNAYADALITLRTERKGYAQTLNNMEGATDADLDKALNGMLAVEEKELNIRKKYKMEFAKVLSIRQVAQLFEAEQEFKKMIIQKAGERAEGGNGMPRRRMMGR
jgi:hypothetical protein